MVQWRLATAARASGEYLRVSRCGRMEAEGTDAKQGGSHRRATDERTDRVRGAARCWWQYDEGLAGSSDFTQRLPLSFHID